MNARVTALANALHSAMWAATAKLAVVRQLAVRTPRALLAVGTVIPVLARHALLAEARKLAMWAPMASERSRKAAQLSVVGCLVDGLLDNSLRSVSFVQKPMLHDVHHRFEVPPLHSV